MNAKDGNFLLPIVLYSYCKWTCSGAADISCTGERTASLWHPVSQQIGRIRHRCC